MQTIHQELIDDLIERLNFFFNKAKPGNLLQHLRTHPESKEWDAKYVAFKKFFRKLLPDKIGKHALRNDLIPEISSEMQEKMQNKLINAIYICLLTDIWSNVNETWNRCRAFRFRYRTRNHYNWFGKNEKSTFCRKCEAWN